ncbi:hypothetical protein KY290_008330 [Solanum tuberosum]|uniref:Uncharacterized protein n=1 Tax=Solanum tuberosum TaxID=4113 RepID=A0ABQ7W8A3_SOLTU|nr:hypothetical protein KY289_008718 [Solanum tuberosum]KAH0776919.1 hypothetical protein KY290_008330 [Solanum tuberosum]
MRITTMKEKDDEVDDVFGEEIHRSLPSTSPVSQQILPLPIQDVVEESPYLLVMSKHNNSTGVMVRIPNKQDTVEEKLLDKSDLSVLEEKLLDKSIWSVDEPNDAEFVDKKSEVDEVSCRVR